MIMKRHALWVSIGMLVAGLLLTVSLVRANPFTCDDTANTCTYRVTATEPTTTQGGGSLTNYKQTNIKTSVNGGTFQVIVKPATSASGGGTVIQDVTFATTACAVTMLAVKLSGTNTLLKEGVETAAVGSPVTRDRTTDPTCAPGAVTGSVN
jgi:hypothetical protein